MKTISDYSIFCTKEQTRKALKLGAPIDIYYNEDIEHTCIIEGLCWNIPTAEQMMGWLRKEKGLFVEPYLNGECCYSFSPIVSTKEDGEIIHLEAEDDPDKATLVAIDAALEYLTNKKEVNKLKMDSKWKSFVDIANGIDYSYISTNGIEDLSVKRAQDYLNKHHNILCMNKEQKEVLETFFVDAFSKGYQCGFNEMVDLVNSMWNPNNKK